MGKLTDKLVHAWNAFKDPNDRDRLGLSGGGSWYGGQPGRTRLSTIGERTIITSIYTRIAIDVASVALKHIRLDEQGRYKEDVDSGLNYCLTVEANLDQGARHLRQDIVMTMLGKGVAAIVPVDTSINPATSGSFDIKTMRVGEIANWYPKKILANLYNEEEGIRKEILLDKKFVAIAENPFYAVMNEPNSTLQRLIRKLNLLDIVDEASSSGKLDIIIQLPYTIKSESRREQANQRLQDIEHQLKTSAHGIAYADATEKITQLNRPAENSLLAQVEYLMKMLYAQLGLTEEVMNGTADEKTMLNYRNRTIEPIVTSIVEAMRRSFLTKTARSQKQSIDFFIEPFKLVPISEIAEIADKFMRNEVVAANEIRGWIGLKPSTDSKADELRNSNMPQPSDKPAVVASEPKPSNKEGDSQNGS